MNFVGHAQTWWGNIDKNHVDQSVMYPKGPVTPGGLTDRYLSDYPNMYGDLSAGSGLNAVSRDEDFARDFLKRHQDKLVYGSDCSDHEGSGPKCQAAQTIAAIPLAGNRRYRKLLHANAKKLFRLWRAPYYRQAQRPAARPTASTKITMARRSRRPGITAGGRGAASAASRAAFFRDEFRS